MSPAKYILILILFLLSCGTSKHENFNRRKYLNQHLKHQYTQNKIKSGAVKTYDQKRDSLHFRSTNTFKSTSIPVLPVCNKTESDHQVKKPIGLPTQHESENNTLPYDQPKNTESNNNRKYTPDKPERSKERKHFNKLFFRALYLFLTACLIFTLSVLFGLFSATIVFILIAVILSFVISIIALKKSKNVPKKDRDLSFTIQMVLLFLATFGVGATILLGLPLFIFGF